MLLSVVLMCSCVVVIIRSIVCYNKDSVGASCPPTRIFRRHNRLYASQFFLATSASCASLYRHVICRGQLVYKYKRCEVYNISSKVGPQLGSWSSGPQFILHTNPEEPIDCHD